jgi:hypothetical protein
MQLSQSVETNRRRAGRRLFGAKSTRRDCKNDGRAAHYPVAITSLSWLWAFGIYLSPITFWIFVIESCKWESITS